MLLLSFCFLLLLYIINPYSVEIWSATRVYGEAMVRGKAVLILILLEYGLQLPQHGSQSKS